MEGGNGDVDSDSSIYVVAFLLVWVRPVVWQERTPPAYMIAGNDIDAIRVICDLRVLCIVDVVYVCCLSFVPHVAEYVVEESVA